MYLCQRYNLCCYYETSHKGKVGVLERKPRKINSLYDHPFANKFQPSVHASFCSVVTGNADSEISCCLNLSRLRRYVPAAFKNPSRIFLQSVALG